MTFNRYDPLGYNILHLMRFDDIMVLLENNRGKKSMQLNNLPICMLQGRGDKYVRYNTRKKLSEYTNPFLNRQIRTRQEPNIKLTLATNDQITRRQKNMKSMIHRDVHHSRVKFTHTLSMINKSKIHFHIQHDKQ